MREILQQYQCMAADALPPCHNDNTMGADISASARAAKKMISASFTEAP
jgi:hypothetical protein